MKTLTLKARTTTSRTKMRRPKRTTPKTTTENTAKTTTMRMMSKKAKQRQMTRRPLKSRAHEGERVAVREGGGMWLIRMKKSRWKMASSGFKLATRRQSLELRKLRLQSDERV